MMARSIVAGILAAAVMGTFAISGQAAVVAPVKPYAKPNEPVAVKFLNETEQGKKALEKIGLAATELDGLFTPVKWDEVFDAGGKPLFSLYTFDGKKIEPQEVKVQRLEGAIDGVDLATFYPQVKDGGTYLLVWKDATPLVIETLRNPIPWASLMDESHISAAQRDQVIKGVASEKPVATHIELLEYAAITTDKGPIKAKFAYDAAPQTVDNFISLAREKLYDGSAFHRIMSGFMIQGGDSLANVNGRAGTGGPGYAITAEFSDKLHERGVLSMARMSTGVDTAGAQFFIMHKKNTGLDGLYSAFGDVFEGMNIVDKIAETPSEQGSGAVTGEKPKIESIRILPATPEMYGLKK